jgi:hypothetical protein
MVIEDRLPSIDHFDSGKMKRIFFVILFVVSIIFPSRSLATKFDIWETGMSINEAVTLARQHDIPIARDGIVHGYKKFSPKLIDENFYKASALYYRTIISGRHSTVYLRLTGDSKFVREIEVRLFGIKDRELFTKEMVGILSRKYGGCKELRETVFRVYEWRPDKSSKILMRAWSAEASITYTDLKIKDYLEKQRIEKEKKSIKKDAEKF